MADALKYLFVYKEHKILRIFLPRKLLFLYLSFEFVPTPRDVQRNI